MKHVSTLIVALTLLLFVGMAVAEDAEERGKKRRGAPQEAIDACSAAVEGDTCAFVGRRDQEVSGTCAVKRTEALICRPDNPGPRLRRKDRQEEESDDAGSIE